MEYLRSIDISTINWIKDRPITDAYKLSLQHCSDTVLKFFQKLYIDNINKPDSTFSIQASKMLDMYTLFLESSRSVKDEQGIQWNTISFGKKLTEYMNRYPDVITKQKITRSRVNGYVFSKAHMEQMLKSLGLLSEMTFMFMD